MRFLGRTASFLVLVAAIVAGTFDAIATVAAGHAVTTPFSAAWREAGLTPLADLDRFADGLPATLKPAVEAVFGMPAFGVLLVVALLLYCASYRRRPSDGRRALN